MALFQVDKTRQSRLLRGLWSGSRLSTRQVVSRVWTPREADLTAFDFSRVNPVRRRPSDSYPVHSPGHLRLDRHYSRLWTSG